MPSLKWIPATVCGTTRWAHKSSKNTKITEVLLSFDLPVDLREARFWMAKQSPQVAIHTNLALIFF
jgi:hypothetical protein